MVNITVFPDGCTRLYVNDSWQVLNKADLKSFDENFILLIIKQHLKFEKSNNLFSIECIYKISILVQ